MQDSSTMHAGFRPEIEGLRALAVIAVIMNHFDKNVLPGGYLGVDIFFVISGFVITASMTRRPARNFGDFLLQFYTRRIKRLVPALVLCVAVTSLAVITVDPKPEISLTTGITALFGFSNLYLFSQATDYYAPSTELNGFTQTWSLGVEEQFYLVYPLLIWFALLRNPATGKSLPAAILGGLCILSGAAFIFLYKTNQPAAYFLMPTRFFELGSGCLLFLLAGAQHSRRASGFFGNAPGLLILAGLVAVLFAPLSFAREATFAAVLLTVSAIAGTSRGSLAHAILTFKPLVFIGLISYSLYLWHWPVLSVSRWTLGVNWAYAPVLLGLMLLLAAASYFILENPLRKAHWSKSNGRSIAYGLVATSVTGFAIFMLLAQRDFIYKKLGNQVDFPVAFLPIRPSGLPYDPTCVVDGQNRLLKPDTMDLCTVPPSAGAIPTIWALGDSHAGHLQGLLYALHDKTGMGVHLIETPGIIFPMLEGNIFEPRKIIFDRILDRMHAGDIILISRLFLDRQTGKPDNIEAWSLEVEKLSGLLARRNVHVLIAGPPPMFFFEHIKTCQKVPGGHTSCDIDRTSQIAGINAIYDSLNRLAASDDNILVLNSFNILCGEQHHQCSPVRDGEFIFRDKDHLNSLGAAVLAEPLINLLRQHRLLANLPPAP